MGFLLPRLHAKITAVQQGLLDITRCVKMIDVVHNTLDDRYEGVSISTIMWYAPNKLHMTLQPHYRYYSFNAGSAAALRLLVLDARFQLWQDLSRVFHKKSVMIAELRYFA